MGSLEGIADPGETFSNLGLNVDLAGKFFPVILDFAQTKGGDTVINLLKGACSRQSSGKPWHGPLPAGRDFAAARADGRSPIAS